MDLWPLLFGVSWSHTYRRTVGLLWTSDQPVAETSTYTGQHKRQTSMPRARFEPTTPATKRPQTYALDRAANMCPLSQANTRQFFLCLFYDTFSVTIVCSVSVTSEWWIDEDKHPCLKWNSNPRSHSPVYQGLCVRQRGHWTGDRN
jgi:hypothetical protein